MLDFNRYLIFHELGHCKDNFLREDRIDLPQIPSKWLRIDNVAAHYIPIIAGEMAACIHSAPGMTLDVFRHENTSTNETIVKILDDLENLRTSLVPLEEKVVKIAHKAFGAFWTVLVQYSKLVGSQIGNEKLASIPMEFWAGCNQDSVLVLNDFFAQLHVIWETYPEWTNTTFNFASESWQKLALANKFTFKKGQESDGVWWN